MTTYAWPSILKPQSFGFFPVDAETSGGAAALGEQYVMSPGGRWGAELSLRLRNKDEVLVARALRAKLMGRAHSVALPNFDGKRLSWPEETFNGDPTGRILHPGVTRIKKLDGTAYASSEIPSESAITATVETNADVRDTELEIESTQGGALIAGQQFGLGSGVAMRLYEIASVDDVTGDVTTVTIWPPLRAAATAGATVNFTRPTCVMRCMNLNEELRKLDMLRFATLNLSFVEFPA